MAGSTTPLLQMPMDIRTLDFDSLAQTFLNYCAIERGLSSNTIAAYRRDLTKFAEFLSGRDLTLVDPKTISDFEVSLRLAKLSPASINRIESTLRSFFRRVDIEHGLANPTLDIEMSKSPRRLPKALTVAQILLLIESAFHAGEPITWRDKAMIEVLYGSGARVSELIGINLIDINISETGDGEITTVKLRGKGGKERVVPLGSYATKAIDDYRTRIRPALSAQKSGANSALFLNSRGARITRQSAWSIVLKAAQRAGISEKVSPHVFRHSYATHLLDGGADIRVVQELLGHASVTTTQIYTLITIDKVREVYSTAHPRA